MPGGPRCTGATWGTTLAPWHPGTLAPWHPGTLAPWHPGNAACRMERTIATNTRSVVDTHHAGEIAC
jgi:hypothetical protein